MESAKQLATVITLLLGVLLNNSKWAGLGQVATRLLPRSTTRAGERYRPHSGCCWPRSRCT